MRLRDLPSVDELVRDASADPLAVAAARACSTAPARRSAPAPTPGTCASGWRSARGGAAARAPPRPERHRVLVHTNLGRAPLAEAALARVHEVGGGYSNLEYDLSTGSRGSRQDHLAPLLRRLTGAEAAIVVNNNAAALLLALAALAEGREVVVSRGELIEIGDGFRIPDVLARSGARLVEVGTTNRTRAADYERAIGPETALLLRVHQSNFRVVGFAEQPRLEELAAVARRHELPLVDDLGSGALVERRGRADARRERLRQAPTSSASPATSCSAGRRRGSSPAGPIWSSGCAATRSSARCAPTSSRSPRSKARSRSISTGRTRFRCCACCASRPRPFAPAPSGSPRRSAVRSRRRSRGSAAARSRSRSFRATPAPSRRSSPPRCAAHEPPVIAVVRDGHTLLDCRTLTDAEADEVAEAVRACRSR